MTLRWLSAAWLLALPQAASACDLHAGNWTSATWTQVHEALDRHLARAEESLGRSEPANLRILKEHVILTDIPLTKDRLASLRALATDLRSYRASLESCLKEDEATAKGPALPAFMKRRPSYHRFARFLDHYAQTLVAVFDPPEVTAPGKAKAWRLVSDRAITGLTRLLEAYFDEQSRRGGRAVASVAVTERRLMKVGMERMPILKDLGERECVGEATAAVQAISDLIRNAGEKPCAVAKGTPKEETP